MNKSTLLLVLLVSMCSLSFAQSDTAAVVKKDSAAYKDSIRAEKLFSKAIYPLIKNSKWSGVLPVEGIDEKPVPGMKYKLLVEITGFKKDSAAVKEVAGELAEVGRIMNLHIAAGVPKENLEVVVVAHGPVLNAFLTNKEYNKKFHIDNPNVNILDQFTASHVKFIACGQAMHFFEVPKEAMLPLVKVTFSAKVALATYRLKGFASFYGE